MRCNLMANMQSIISKRGQRSRERDEQCPAHHQHDAKRGLPCKRLAKKYRGKDHDKDHTQAIDNDDAVYLADLESKKIEEP